MIKKQKIKKYIGFIKTNDFGETYQLCDISINQKEIILDLKTHIA
ncbi:hypothetical protein GGR42_001496 [Saonia flava]|uniref:Uncharacterized protein n=1 Tax=Saonia flava TaxID=523696 RepID=A0A846R0Y8_9FLAO|nr:hypothetical protein [Saonia flava]NJB71034.1 hypothetical protein [Saonia flava]